MIDKNALIIYIRLISLEDKMKSLDRALNELYNASDEPESASEHIESAIGILEESLNMLGSQMASDEIIDLIGNLKDDIDLDGVIFELEVINNELNVDIQEK